ISTRAPGDYLAPAAAPSSDMSSGLRTVILLVFCLGGSAILVGVIFTIVICFKHFRDRAWARARARALEAARADVGHIQLQLYRLVRRHTKWGAIVVHQMDGGVILGTRS
ncbi:hypothetical protein MKW92_051340, partial [Papaver armeniacum]